MPHAIQDAYRIGQPINSYIIRYSPLFNRESTAIAEVIQWGTLIIFDNLIGHYDRYTRVVDRYTRVVWACFRQPNFIYMFV